jgi:Predicted membrane protein
MWERELLGISLYHIVQWFVMYSFFGWVSESIYMSICNRKLTNRGFMFGPFCPIYGVGALCIYFILRPFSRNVIALYIAGALLATAFEYVVARLMQFVFGDVWWDYNDKPFNYKGVLCLESSIAWGLYTVLMFKFLHEIVNDIISRYSYQRGIMLGTAVIIIMAIDMTFHIAREKKELLNSGVDTIKGKIRNIRS